MLTRFLCLVCLVSATSTGWAGDAKKELEKLQGTWVATEAIGNGNLLPKEEMQRIKMEFTGEKLDFFPPDGDGKQKLNFTFKLNAGQMPKSIDLTRLREDKEGKTGRAIYEIRDDTLKVCFPAKPDQARPTEFASPEGSELILITLKRAVEEKYKR